LFHAGSAPGVHPAKLCSSRAGFRRLRLLSPPVVPRNRSPLRRASVRPRKRCRSAVRHVERVPETSSPSGVCSTRESATTKRLFYGRPERVALLGFRPPGVSPSPEWLGFHRASPLKLTKPGASDLLGGSSGYRFRRGRLVSLETAAPPGLPPPSDRHDCLGRTPARESPPQASGCVTVPSTSHL
jgi:hypothetical protein